VPGESSATGDRVRASSSRLVVPALDLDEPLSRQARDTAGDKLGNDHGAAEHAEIGLPDLDLCAVERYLGCFGDDNTPPLSVTNA